MKKRSIFVGLIVVFVLILGGMSNMQAQAKSSQNEKAKKEYGKLLNKKKYKEYSFALVDMNKNGVVELLLQGKLKNGAYQICIFQYAAGNVKKIVEKDRAQFTDIYFNAGSTLSFDGSAYGVKNYSIYSIGAKGITYRFNLRRFAYVNRFSKKVVRCYFSGMRILESKFYYYEKKYAAPERKLTFLKNTKANQKLYLKNTQSLSIKKGSSKKMVLDTSFAKKVSWKSNHKEVATVSQSGKITCKRAGSATITATLVFANYTEQYEYNVKGLAVNDVTKQLVTNKKLNQLLDQFEYVVGYEVLAFGNAYSACSDKFKIAVAAWNTKNSYIMSDLPGGTVVHKKLDVYAKARQIFGGAPSRLDLPVYRGKGYQSTYMGITQKGGDQIVKIGRETQKNVTSQITKIKKYAAGVYKVTVQYKVYNKNNQNKTVEKQKSVVYTLKKINKSTFGYIVTGLKIN